MRVKNWLRQGTPGWFETGPIEGEWRGLECEFWVAQSPVVEDRILGTESSSSDDVPRVEARSVALMVGNSFVPIWADRDTRRWAARTSFVEDGRLFSVQFLMTPVFRRSYI